MILRTPRILLAGTSSGVGKTSVACAIIGALRARGFRVQPFKCGPDYLDPGHLSCAAGRPCINLDTWMLTDDQVRDSFARASQDSDVAVIEGVMGLFDGANFEDDRGSAAHVARLLGAPVILVADISRAGRSIAATVSGFASFAHDVPIRGVILNNAGSHAHAEGCRTAIESETSVRVLGAFRRMPALRIPERHLGLTSAGEATIPESLYADLAAIGEATCNLPALLAIAMSARPLPCGVPPAAPAEVTSTKNASRPILAVARDHGFSFYYPENLALLENAGARIVFFSPLAGESIPPDAAGVYLGGGYPELHAEALSRNARLKSDLHALRDRGGLIWAECGGFMVLTEAIVDSDGRRWPMAGLIPGETRMTDRLAGFGYRIVKAVDDNLLATRGETLRGHEFHHSTWHPDPQTARKHNPWHTSDSKGRRVDTPTAYAEDNLLAGYLHIHLGQSPRLPHRIVKRLANAASSFAPA